MRQRLAYLLDIVSLVQSVRRGMLGIDRGTAMVIWVLTGLGALVTGTVTWVVDWLPTWRFANGEEPPPMSYSTSTIAQAAIGSVAYAGEAIAGIAAITLGGFIGGLIAVGVTLFPTIIQFVAPRVIHPIAQMGMDISIGFDFVTDWPSATQQAASITQHPIGQFLLTLLLVFVYSLVLQSFFVLFLTAFVMSTLILLSGRAPGAFTPAPPVVLVTPPAAQQ